MPGTSPGMTEKGQAQSFRNMLLAPDKEPDVAVFIHAGAVAGIDHDRRYGALDHGRPGYLEARVHQAKIEDRRVHEALGIAEEHVAPALERARRARACAFVLLDER